MRPSRRAVALVTVPLLVLAAAGLAKAAERTIGARPTSAPSGTAVAVAGSGFAPFEAVDVYLDERDVALAVAGRRGRIGGVSVRIPRDTPPGRHWLTAVGRRSGASAQTAIEVLPRSWATWTHRGGGPGRTGVQELEPYLGSETLAGLRPVWSTRGSILEPLVLGRIVVGVSSSGFDDPATLHGFDGWTGTGRWTFPVGWERAGLAGAGDTVYVGVRGRLVAIDATDGTRRWSARVGPWRGFSTGVAVEGSTAFVATEGPEGTSTVAALDLSTRRVRWTNEVPGLSFGWQPNGPVVSGGIVLVAVGRDRAGVVAFDAASGRKLWARRGGGYAASLAAAGERVYLVGWTGAGGRLDIFDLRSGTRTASAELRYDPNTPWLAVTDDALFLGVCPFEGDANECEVQARDARSGALRWSRRLRSPTGLAAVEGVVFVGGSEGRLAALDPGDGSVLWSRMVAGGLSGRPAIANGTVYVSTWHDRLYALRPSGPPRPDPGSLSPRPGLSPEEPHEVAPLTEGWDHPADGRMPATAGVTTASAVVFEDALYLGTEIADRKGGTAGIWRTRDGARLERVVRFSAAERIVLATFGPRLFAVAEGEHGSSLFVSEDGETFSLVPGVAGPATRAAAPVPFEDLMLLVGSGPGGPRVWWTADGERFDRGSTVGGEIQATGFALDPFVPGGVVFGEALYLGASSPEGGRLWRTAGGRTLELLALPELDTRTARAVVPQVVHEGWLYLVASGPQGVEVLRTSDGAMFDRVEIEGLRSGPRPYLRGSLATVGQTLVLLAGMPEQRRLDTPKPLATGISRGFGLWATLDGDDWRRVGPAGLGDRHDRGGILLETGGVLYLAASNPLEGDAVWSSRDGLAWEAVFREPEPTPFSLGIRPVVFDRHLLLLHGDLARGLSLWRYRPEIPAAGLPPPAEGRSWLAWIAWAVAIGGLVAGFTWLLTGSLGPGRRGGTPPLPRGV